MLKRSLTIALLAGASWMAQAAQAGELTLFSRPEFAGRDVTLQGPVRDLSEIGFDNRASSLVVRSGRWQACARPDFGGKCVVLERGEYPDLNRLNDRISSIREVGGQGWGQERRDGWRDDRDNRDNRYEERADNRYEQRYDERGPAVELYRHAEFSGDRRDTSERVIRDFNAMGFNDRAQSIVIHYGQWEFCEHADFRGQCQVFGPGRYPHLGALSSRLSSMRRVR